MQFDKKKIKVALFYSSMTKYGTQVLGLVSTMIIARILTPNEIGTFAIASALVMIMSEFRLLGAGNYLVREKDLTEDKIRTATGLTMLVSWTLGVLIWFLAPSISAFYNLEELAIIFRILSISFFFAPFISIPSALLSRKMNFKALFYLKFGTTLTRLVITVILVALGFSYYGLAWGASLAVIVEFLFVLVFGAVYVRFVPSVRGLGKIAAFGIYNSASNLLRRGIVTVPDMIIGKMGTPLDVGLFSRGLGFIQFVNQTLIMGVKPVALPYLANLKHSGGEVAGAYVKASVLIGVIMWPVLAVASVVSLPVIRLFFGDQWDQSAPYASILAGWAMLRVVNAFSSDLFITNGREKVLLFREGCVFFLHAFGIFLAFPLGLLSVAYAFLLAGLADLFLTLFLLSRFTEIRVGQMLWAWRGNLVITLLCGAQAFLIYQERILGTGSAVSFIIVCMTLPVSWLALLFILKHPLSFELGSVARALVRKFSDKADPK